MIDNIKDRFKIFKRNKLILQWSYNQQIIIIHQMILKMKVINRQNITIT